MIAASLGEVFDLSFLDGSDSRWSDVTGATATYSVTFTFNTDGTVDVFRSVQGDTTPIGTFVIPGERTTSLYIRCVQNSGQPFNLGAALSTWHALSVGRSFGLQYTSGGGADSVVYDVTFSLALDSGGTNIVATGNPNGEVGELF